ncbi:MAG: non-hydrolyzing UDP-N-acetylglucosamine 2-epimerase [Limisphaerales bacterium]
METELELLIVAGARPNFIKIAPVVKAAEAYNADRRRAAVHLKWRLVHTGQHYDEKMSRIFFQELGLAAPDINLAARSGTHAVQTADIMCRFEQVCLAKRPDWVMVVGDVNSTLACALVCAKMGIKVAHVEAGLRSFDRTMPEEVNRMVTDALADLLLTPSDDADENLRREGIPPARIKLVGNVMIDALVANMASAESCQMLKDLGLQGKSFAYVTLHRPSNVDQKETLSAIMSQLSRLTARLPVVFPLHPRTGKMLAQFGISRPRNDAFHLLEPIGYHDSLHLTKNARFVLTDSGGLQEESTYFRTPCLTLRPNTERPVTVTLGSNRLTHLDRLSEDIRDVLHAEERQGCVPPLWDGKAAGRIIAALVERDQLMRQ